MKTVVFRICGDERYGAAVKDGMVTTMQLKNDELEAVKGEVEALKAREASLGVRKVRDSKYYKRKIRCLDRKYPPERQLSKPERAILVGWAMMWLAINEWYQWFAAWNRES